MKKKEFKIKNIIIILLLFVSIVGLLTSLINIIKWIRDSNETKKQVEIINDLVDIQEVNDNDNIEIIEQQSEIPKPNPYWDYIKMNLIDVDFSELKKTNSDVIGWIQVNGTNINYPFVLTSNNSFYLNHSFNKSYNDAGWVFMDYRNNDNFSHKNNIIYAHGRFDTTMFGSLKNILTNGWLDNSGNYVIKLSTESENTLWQVFSVYKIPTTNDYIQVEFDTDDEYLSFINMIKERSNYDFNTIVNSYDKILTLSTCYNDSDKVVLHAKLIKRESKQ